MVKIVRFYVTAHRNKEVLLTTPRDISFVMGRKTKGEFC